MNLRDLEYLVAVADHRHFGRAAEACEVSQPTLSVQLRKLEQQLGVELIERNPGHILVTPPGELVVERARAILSEAADIDRIAQRAREPGSGTVRMGLFPTLAPYLLPHVVPAIHEHFPDLELLLTEEKTETVLAQLDDGRLDVAVVALPVDDDRLHLEPLFAEDFVLAVPADHPLAGRGPVPSTVLVDQDVLLLDEGHCLRDQALAVCRLVGAAERTGFRATSLETLRQMVAAGVGVTLLPRLAVTPPVPPSPDIALVEFSDPVPRRHLVAAWRPTNVYRDLLPDLAAELRALPPDLVDAAGGA